MTALLASAAGPATTTTADAAPADAAPADVAPAGVEIVRLTIRSAAATEPSLAHPLLPPMADQHAGDAAYAYLIAQKQLPPDYTADHQQDPRWAAFERLEDAPDDRFSPSEAAAVLRQFDTAAIDAAARCDQVHWGAGFREQGVDLRLPYLPDMRSLTRVIALRGRMELARGNFAAATTSMQSGLAMTRHLNAGGTVMVVQALVAAGDENLVLDHCVNRWVATPGSPNLYWALTALPPTFADLYAVGQTEQSWLRFTDRPWMALALDDQLPADHWPRVFDTLIRLSQNGAPTSAGAATATRLRLVAAFAAPAREHLRATGRSATEVAALSDDEAISRYLLWQHQSQSAALWRCWTQPLPEAIEPLRRANAEITAAAQAGNPLLFTGGLTCRYVLASPDRRLAALRVIEALRDFAAKHDGRPPAQLEQVVDLPVPADPLTGRPFVYHANGVSATLDLPAPARIKPYGPPWGRRFELTFVPR